jgi:hypothetical protein
VHASAECLAGLNFAGKRDGYARCLKPTIAIFSFDTGHTTFKSVNWGRAGEQPSSGPDYRKDDIIRVAQQLLSKLPR